MSDPKFKVGDVVVHNPSGRRYVVTRVSQIGCDIHFTADKDGEVPHTSFLWETSPTQYWSRLSGLDLILEGLE